MDDADGITLNFLRECGCKIGADIKTFKVFNAELLVTSLAICLHAIDEKYRNQIKTEMPNSKARRYNYSLKLSNAMKELGYRHELGYDTFMYPSEKSTREILRYAVGRLPTKKKAGGRGRSSSAIGGGFDDDEEDEEVVGSLETRIHKSLKKWMKNKYSVLKETQHISQFTTVSLDFPTELQHAATAMRSQYCESNLDFVCNQTSSADWFLPSILTHNHREYLYEQQKMNKNQYEDEHGSYDIFGDGTGININLPELIRDTIRSEMLFAKKAAKENTARHYSGAFRNSSGGANASSQSGKGKAGASQSNLGAMNDTNTRFESEVKYTQEMNSGGLAVDEAGNILQMASDGNVTLANQSLEEVEEQRKQELEQMRTRIQSLQKRLSKMDSQIESSAQECKQSEAELKENEDETAQLTKECLTKKKTIDLLPNAEENLIKLAKIVSASADRFENLKRKWTKKKSLFMAEFENRKMQMESKKHTANELLLEIKNMRSKMREYGNGIREKEMLLQKLIKKLQKLPKTIDRQVYVDRILGVVQNLENQNMQIRAILEDVKNLQRDTNNISESSKRTFGVVDELVFRTASNTKEINAKRQLNEVYRQVVTMRENFDSIVDTMRTISNTQNEIRDLEYQIDALKDKVENLEMKQIKTDLKEVEQDNEALAHKLKATKKSLKQMKKRLQAK